MPKIVEAWNRIYSAFIRKRFVRASRGDGTWQPLAPSTIARRRKGSSVILRDTGLLFSQLSPGFQKMGPVVKQGQTKFVANVSFGGQGKYPDGATVTDVMSFHQTGGGNLPQRKILVDADEPTRKQMRDAAKRIIIEATS